MCTGYDVQIAGSPTGDSRICVGCDVQKEMLEDHKRTGAYYTAIMQNQAQFKDKVVLDVGAGSGILAIFAAQAGARKVYAVEATAVAQHARKLVQHNRVCTDHPGSSSNNHHLVNSCNEACVQDREHAAT